MSDYTDALDRLANFYNAGVYDVVDNPGGFDQNGHRQNFLDALADIAIVGEVFGSGLHLPDTDDSHELVIALGSNLTADRTLTLITGDADRTLDISAANVVISALAAAFLAGVSLAALRAALGLTFGAGVRQQQTGHQLIYVRALLGAAAISIASPGVVTCTGHGLAANAAVVFSIPVDELAVTMTIASPAVVTWTSHGFAAGQPIKFRTSGALPTGVTEGTTYYVIATGLTGGTFQFSATPGGAAINTSGTQSGTHYGEKTGAFPTGLSEGTIYYVKTVLGVDTFTVSATPGGSVINTSGSQSGSFTAATGSDSNDGSAPTAAGAFLSRQAAWNYASRVIDNAGIYNLLFQCAASTYTDGVTVYGPLPGQMFPSQVIWQGSTTAPSNHKVAMAGATYCFGAGGHSGCSGTTIIQGWRLSNSVGGAIAALGGGAVIHIGAGVQFAACAGHQIVCEDKAQVLGVSDYSVIGNAAAHILCNAGGMVNINNRTITYSNSPTWAGANIQTQDTGSIVLASNVTFVNGGTVTGKRYEILGGAEIVTTGDLTYLPGSVAGTVAQNGIYRGTTLQYSSGVSFPGTSTNDSAASGHVGEYTPSTVTSGSAVSLVTGTAKDLTSISLTAGDWDVCVNAEFAPAATTRLNFVEISVSTTTNTVNNTPGNRTRVTYPINTTLNPNTDVQALVGPVRISIASTTTVYAVANSQFDTSTMSVFGILRARRVR